MSFYSEKIRLHDSLNESVNYNFYDANVEHLFTLQIIMYTNIGCKHTRKVHTNFQLNNTFLTMQAQLKLKSNQ